MPKQYKTSPTGYLPPKIRNCKRPSVQQPSNKSVRIIPLTKSQYAMVSACDYGWLNQWNWFAEWNKATKSYYARRNQQMEGRQVRVSMHREIKGVPYGDKRVVDHKEPSETLNNSRSNLRHADKSKNMHNRRKNSNNTSGTKGVCWMKVCKRWQARIMVNKRSINLGFFKNKKGAIGARREATIKYHGDFGQHG